MTVANTFPINPGPYRLSGSVPVFADRDLTTVINVTDVNGAPLPGNRITAREGMLSPFLAAASVVYIRSDDGGTLTLYSVDINGNYGLPSGGTTGQVLNKASNTDYDVAWAADTDVIHNVPSGGTTGQVLGKNSATDYDVGWKTDTPLSVLHLEAPFAFGNSSALKAGINIAGWVPTAGDLVLAWAISVITAFDGTTPLMDFFLSTTATTGVLATYNTNAFDLTTSADADGATSNAMVLASKPSVALGLRVKTTATHAVIVASQDGTKSGTAIDSSVGSAVLHLLVLPVGGVS